MTKKDEFKKKLWYKRLKIQKNVKGQDVKFNLRCWASTNLHCSKAESVQKTNRNEALEDRE